MSLQAPYPRDMVGYGRTPPDPRWPGGAAVALQFVLNYEEGGEASILHGDAHAESYLAEHIDGPPRIGERHATAESLYEYGSRVGFWRLWRLFGRRGLPVTVFGVASALARNPEAVSAMREAGWEIASHGLRWIDHRNLGEAEERRQIDEAMRLHARLCGAPPRGWYAGRCSDRTLDLLAERDELIYLSDSYSDELPYWVEVAGRAQLIVPYTLDANDMRFATRHGFGSGEAFFAYLRDGFDLLCREGREGRPAMMSVGLHNRIVGRPGRAAALERFLDHVAGRPDVWVCRREEIAAHWRATHPCRAPVPA